MPESTRIVCEHHVEPSHKLMFGYTFDRYGGDAGWELWQEGAMSAGRFPYHVEYVCAIVMVVFDAD